MSAASVVAARTVPAGRGWQWFVDAWLLTAGYRTLFIGLVVGLLALASVVGVLPVVGSFASAFLSLALAAGLMLGCDALRAGAPLKIDHLFAGFQGRRPKLVMLAVIFAAANFALTMLGDVIAGPGGIDVLLDALLGVLLGGAMPDLVLIQSVMQRALLAMLVMLALGIPLYMALWFALPLVVLRELDVLPAMRLSLAACLKNMQPFLVWSLPPLAVTIVLAVPFTAAIAARSLVLGLVSTPLLVLDFVLLLALTFASIYTSYRDVFALGD